MNELLLTPEEIRIELVNNGIEPSPYIEAACEVSNEAQIANLKEPVIIDNTTYHVRLVPDELLEIMGGKWVEAVGIKELEV